MPSSRPIDRLRDVADNCARILTYTANIDFATYAADAKTRDAVERCFQRISEAACKIGAYLDARYPNVDWKGARGIGNPLRHQYDQISAADLWDGIVNDVPGLYRSALDEIARLEQEGDAEP
jgi:uncharacterized protein with HEPN domain